MSPVARISHRVAVILLLLAVTVMGFGVWAQIEQNRLDRARSDAAVLNGAAGFDAVAVPMILRPFENGALPAAITGNRGTVFGVFARIGGAIGLFGLVLLSLRTRNTPARVLPPDLDDIDPPTMAEAQAAPMADWQQKLALRMARDVRGSKPAARQGTTRSLGTTLYRLLFGLVATCFLLLAGALLVNQAQGPALPEIGASLDQFIMTIRVALGGDRTALLGVIKVIAVICGSLIVLRVLLVRRKPGKSKDRLASAG